MMDRARWAALFETARSSDAAADLVLLADAAPDTDTRVEALGAAVRALQAAGAADFADRQLERLRGLAPAVAERLRLSPEPPRPRPPAITTAVVFGGHMVDAPGRRTPRFPGIFAEPVAVEIRNALGRIGVRAGDRAIASAAAGGDLLFIDAALSAGMTVTACLPSAEERFMETSVSFAGPEWTTLYARLTRSQAVTVRQMPELELVGESIYERCNRWMAYLALGCGAATVRGIVVWDGKPGDGPGGTGHLYEVLREYGIPVDVISPGSL